ncbi:MAG TPA: hypothetical protein VED17_10330 [Nitrososphaerales archaeon]|nr:hypothetical protein [Nitrososphaerales archaeon]
MSIEKVAIQIFQNVIPFLQGGAGIFGNEGPVEYALDAGTAVFSFVLFVVTIYAWLRRSRQLTLLIVSFGFLSFFIMQAAEAFPYPVLHGELFESIMSFISLTLFFIALVVRPQRSKTLTKTD